MTKRKSCITETTFNEGLAVFVPDPEQVWIPGIVKAVKGSTLLVKTALQEVTVNKKNVLLKPSENYLNCDYLTKLNLINPATVLHCLDLRFQQDVIYTVSGNMLVAVNPFKELPTIYERAVLLSYTAEKSNALEPHIYSSARAAYNCMIQHVGKAIQIIVVCGESGAGKTVSAMYLLKYLTVVSNLQTSLDNSLTSSTIEKKILKSNPILEAFGNAITTRNENSSRFGKFIQLHFNRSGNMKGATVSTYLLEKTRVTHQGTGECNFHIFYQMLQGLKQENNYGYHPQNWCISDDLKFRILPECSGRTDEMDSKKLQNTLQALEEVGVTENQKQFIFRILLGILYLCNVEFTKGQDEECAAIKNSTESVAGVNTASEQLGIDSKKLQQVLLHRSIHSGSKARLSVFVKPVRMEEANSRRDCLAMLLYSKLFDWLIKFINSQFKTGSCQEIIGLLDIYGFECFEQNSLEQLCINYANERLQQHFVQHFLKNLQEEYIQENVGWTYTDYSDNQSCIDILDGIPGIFSILNEEVYLNRQVNIKALDERFSKLTHGIIGGNVLNGNPTSHARNETTPISTPRSVNRRGLLSKQIFPLHMMKDGSRQKAGPEFIVKHFAGDVPYQVSALVDKNKDNIPAELESLIMSSHLDFVKQIMDVSTIDLERTSQEQPGKKKKTVLTKFKSSLDQLMSSLNAADVHYVRCLKPNSESIPNKFDRLYMMSQLKANGIIETVKISQQGHPARFTYHDFLQRYYMILSQKYLSKIEPNNNHLHDTNLSLDVIMESISNQRLDISKRSRKSATPRKVMRRRTGLASSEHLMKCCAAILNEVSESRNGVDAVTFTRHFGKNKIFLSQLQFDKLESARSLVIIEKVVTIQQAWHRYQQRKYLWRRKKAVLCIEKAVLRWLGRRRDQLQQLLKMANNLELNDNSEAGVYPLSNIEVNSTSHQMDLNANQHDNVQNLIQLNTVSSVLRNNNDCSQSECFKTDNDKCTHRRTCLLSGFGPDPGEPPQKRLKISCQQYASLKNVSIGDGVISRRRLPRVAMRFHTKPSILKNAHITNFKELQCSLTDILPDIS